MKRRVKIKKKSAKMNPKISQKSSENVFGSQIRERRKIDVLDERQVLAHASKVPNCPHGPCLLFADSGNNRWFACAVFRSQKICKFRIYLNPNGKFEEFEPSQIYSHPIKEYGKVANSFHKFIGNGVQPYWCQQCTEYKRAPHKHDLLGPILDWQNPLDLLGTIQEDNAEAQYLFDERTIYLVEDACEREGVDSFLCIGTPSLFEKFRLEGKNSFLLDFDDRLSLFYSPTEFARFSMLVCHFYLAESQQFFLQFLQKSRRIVCLCDPPFGVHISGLIRTIQQIKQWFFGEKSEKCGRIFNTILFLPYFIGKHLPNEFPLSMVDYKVTYSNHRVYCRPKKSIVRIFTDLANISFQLPTKMGYHFCEECNRFVANENRHCWKCGECTSKDGTPFVHCDRCGRCVRKKYKHCRNCSFCHLAGRCIKKE